MAKIYVYPAVFEPNENGVLTVTFPDLPGCITEGDTPAEALAMAQEAMGLHLYGSEKDGDPIPAPSIPSNHLIHDDAADGTFISLVTTNTALISREIQNRYVRKTVTLPHWMNVEAEALGLNFSQTLQAAIREKLQYSLRERLEAEKNAL
ncbi:pilus biosynthesis protein HicB [Paenibacillus sp. 598K]|uniref:type II toxin-antitoxin system HicB family antitoxin n=1 Tax=Paenibacillus sp. 598K TaxID=1117987 RepID=UPI000FF95E8B|nr:type II toxin-antitoxin system HicB family antitoxin [Paenibacillus sp. 598K]GBF76707.1 pilus biosynthesis protein HicB [Paenibacillus sp. 598K]